MELGSFGFRPIDVIVLLCVDFMDECACKYHMTGCSSVADAK